MPPRIKPGCRALGIAESYRDRDDGATSTLCGAVVRADRAVDDVEVATCTVGGRDATEAMAEVWRRLDRPDVRYVLVAGVALAWYNVIDLAALATATDRPVVAVTFEESDGLENGIEAAFDGEARATRLSAYRNLPERRRIEVDGRALFVRSVGLEAAAADAVVDAYTHERRPEPLRVAKRIAGRLDAARREGVLPPE
ncbi:UPF0215 family protein [Natronomonas moolapensis 8.8.11]|uniref:UPF0215 protein Nmlp_3823 n=1 Tax=Natronomonas moolapensis (strain DSM 18674 / CECT 7526 / JCM 14361 / 8.8.11) TaxID=268739 RepID=M1Y5T5_NATM8|nr:UPF0215 family protein [Natronomonas moolapensis 8.8.11]